MPFAVPLPDDAPPTGEAVHSSLVWFLEATLMYAKWTQGIEKVRGRSSSSTRPRHARDTADASAICSARRPHTGVALELFGGLQRDHLGAGDDVDARSRARR